MYRISKLLLIYILFHTTTAQAQSEFQTYTGGLIYPDSTISQLKHIVDSLNLKFKMCDLDRQYHSLLQARAHYVEIEGRDARKAKTDIDNGITFDSLIAKYPRARVQKDQLVVRESTSKKNNEVYTLSNLPLGSQWDWSIASSNGSSGKCLYEFHGKRDYGEASIEACYILEPFTSKALPQRYARYIQYADCLVDTTAVIYTKNAYRDYRYAREKNALPLMEWIESYVGRSPFYTARYDDTARFRIAYEQWQFRRDSLIQVLSQRDSFRVMLDKSIAFAEKKGGSNDEFESFVEHNVSPASALELKRSRIVVGGCSMDFRPRYHAFEIARLSASAVKWEIFLRAHLDIMNDRFERNSDGSYAWAARQTYIAELETLDINVPELMAGIAFRVSDASDQHYYGSISRIGRALAESKSRNEIKLQTLGMIEDPELDLYNRLLMFYLFLQYNQYLGDKHEKLENASRLREAIKTLPGYMSNPASATIDRFMKDE